MAPIIAAFFSSSRWISSDESSRPGSSWLAGAWCSVEKHLFSLITFLDSRTLNIGLNACIDLELPFKGIWHCICHVHNFYWGPEAEARAVDITTRQKVKVYLHFLYAACILCMAIASQELRSADQYMEVGRPSTLPFSALHLCLLPLNRLQGSVSCVEAQSWHLWHCHLLSHWGPQNRTSRCSSLMPCIVDHWSISLQRHFFNVLLANSGMSL